MTIMHVALIAASLLGSAALAAQPAPERPTGSRVPTVSDLAMQDREVRKYQGKYGRCIVAREQAAARRFVLVAESKMADSRGVSKILDPDCLIEATAATDGVQMRFPADSLRQTLAEALLLREFATVAVPPVKDAGPIAQLTFAEADYLPKPGSKPKPNELESLAAKRSRQLAMVFLSEFGECVARADPARGFALVRTAPDSVEEKAALKSLQPAFAGCLSATESLQFTRSMLRGAVAINLYRLAHAPRAAAAAGAPR